jgi:hypothetical protein
MLSDKNISVIERLLLENRKVEAIAFELEIAFSFGSLRLHRFFILRRNIIKPKKGF